jgi:8-oxo-dGTP pyrophosphatase MutT (NUDIX family)/phosphohistidine phosphatase SixA
MASTPNPGRDVLAAGAVVLRKDKVLLVHRPAYDDWSFPKGKLERGESFAAAAVREVAEETGLGVRLGIPLSTQRYPNGARMKRVDYWVGRVADGHDVESYKANAEIDDVAWVDVSRAVSKLSYSRDRETLTEALGVGKPTRALLVLRHGQARSRKAWRRDDRRRPLLALGRRQALEVVPLLDAYGVTRIVSSSSTRCVETVTPYAEWSGRKVRTCDGLSEEDATSASVRETVGELVAARVSAVICTHRPVLPRVFESLGIEVQNQATGELVVVHHRHGRVLAVERHPA